MSARKLWKVTYNGEQHRPESKVKAYDIHVENARRTYQAGNGGPHVSVWVDERDGRGWQLYERVNVAVPVP